MNLQFTGKITRIGDLKSFPTASGQTISKRELTITSDEEFPQSVNGELVNDVATNFTGQVGQTVTANLRLTTSTSQQGRVFTNIKIWRLD